MLLGSKHSIETKLKISELQKGEKSYWFGKKLSQETKDKISKANSGKKQSPETLKKLIAKRKGRKHTVEARIKISIAMTGSKNSSWKGGVSNENKLIRKSLEYRLWRINVFKRDNYTCVLCNDKSGKIEADHIKSFSLFPKLRFKLSNGRTLCKSCHRKTDTYGYKSKKICN